MSEGILKLKGLKCIVCKISRVCNGLFLDNYECPLCPPQKKNHVWFVVLSYLKLKCIIIK